jgi:hypothetical protein
MAKRNEAEDTMQQRVAAVPPLLRGEGVRKVIDPIQSESAGVYSDRGVEKKGKGRQFRTLGFHSLRHTGNRGVVANDCDQC